MNFNKHFCSNISLLKLCVCRCVSVASRISIFGLIIRVMTYLLWTLLFSEDLGPVWESILTQGPWGVKVKSGKNVNLKLLRLLLSIVCPQGALQLSPLCHQSPRRRSCGRPCWRRPPGTQRRQTGCRLEGEWQTVETSLGLVPGLKPLKSDHIFFWV